MPYLVSFTVPVASAEDPVAAARDAWVSMVGLLPGASTFTVLDQLSGQTFEVDLMDDTDCTCDSRGWSGNHHDYECALTGRREDPDE